MLFSQFNCERRGMFFSFLQSFLQFNRDISGWDVSNVQDMRWMFQDSQFNGDISGWNVSNVQRMGWMFGNSQFNGDLSRWDVSNVTNVSNMFDNSPLANNKAVVVSQIICGRKVCRSPNKETGQDKKEFFGSTPLEPYLEN